MKRLLCAMLAVLVLMGCAAAPVETTLAPTTVPEETSGPVLKSGYYVPVDEMFAESMIYIQLHPNGSGVIFVMGMSAELAWSPEFAAGANMSIYPSDEGLLVDGERFRYCGEALPEGYLPDPPETGVYVVSSVGLDGDVEFFNALDRANGYFELYADDTGVLVFDGVHYPFVLEGINAKFDGWTAMLMDRTREDTDSLAMIYIVSGPIQADSIAFHKVEG